MKALILAAGQGTRLTPITDTLPKALVCVNGKEIIVNQIECLHQNGIFDITVIVGYKADILQRKINTMFQGVNFIFSEHYSTTNNMYSALLGREAINDDDFLMMNADVFFDQSIIQALCMSTEKNAIATDVGIYIEESMKVVKKNGKLIKIAKTISSKEAFGVSIDVYKFSCEAGVEFFAKCAEYIHQRHEVKLWSEVAINDIFSYVSFAACPFEGRWIEIDNLDDLRMAEKMFAAVKP